MSLVFQNIDPQSPSPPGECDLPPPPHQGGGAGCWGGGGGGGTHSPGEEGDGSIFWKTRDIGLPSYSK
jgi:hypothetical protein